MRNPFRSKQLGSTDSFKDIEACTQQLTSKVQSRLATLSRSVSSTPNGILDEIAQTFAYTHHITDAIRKLKPCLSANSNTACSTELDFLVSSIFLREACTYLTSDSKKRERMALVSGPVANNGTVILSSMHKVQTSQQSPAYVQADPAATARQIDHLVSNDQHQLWGMFHSHILHGKNSTQPSQTDINHQNRLVKFGMPDTLGGIFSLDGWVRIFSTAKPFSLTVYGGGVEVVEDNPREKILKISLPEVHHVVPQN
ncbi:MAG: Mov34/MPN/PAD-1 family protein [Hyphomicrobiaceae bacterium]